jgi:hypothetical protein
MKKQFAHFPAQFLLQTAAAMSKLSFWIPTAMRSLRVSSEVQSAYVRRETRKASWQMPC